jgi:hypothetical protein
MEKETSNPHKSSLTHVYGEQWGFVKNYEGKGGGDEW